MNAQKMMVQVLSGLGYKRMRGRRPHCYKNKILFRMGDVAVTLSLSDEDSNSEAMVEVYGTYKDFENDAFATTFIVNGEGISTRREIFSIQWGKVCIVELFQAILKNAPVK